MERFVGKVAIVTGASAGIGLEITKLLLKHGLLVVGLARHLPALEEVQKIFQSESYSGKFFPYKCDVSDPKQIRETFKHVTTNIGPVSVLINNAGVFTSTYLSDLDEKNFDETFDTNVKGLMLCSREAMMSMLNSDVTGHIVNINSLLGHQFLNVVLPDHFLYTISKHAVTAATEALQREVTAKNVNIKVSSISPGLVETPFSRRSLGNLESIGEDKKLQASDVAHACIKVLDTPPLVLIPELTITAIHQSL